MRIITKVIESMLTKDASQQWTGQTSAQPTNVWGWGGAAPTKVWAWGGYSE